MLLSRMLVKIHLPLEFESHFSEWIYYMGDVCFLATDISARGIKYPVLAETAVESRSLQAVKLFLRGMRGSLGKGYKDIRLNLHQGRALFISCI